jgi:hypothetical protein
MKKSTLSLLLAFGVLFSLNAFAADKVKCFKLKASGKLQEREKKKCSGKWSDSEEGAIKIAKDKCDKKAKRGKHEWKDTDGKDGKGRCVKVKGLFKKKLSNNVVALESDIESFCLTKVMGDKNLCKKAKKKYAKLQKKNCKKEAKATAKERNKGLGKKIKALFAKKKSKDGTSCKDFGKERLECLMLTLDGKECGEKGGN